MTIRRSRGRNSFDTRRDRVRITREEPAPRRPCRDALASVGADLSALLSARRMPTVLPFAPYSSPRRFVTWLDDQSARLWLSGGDTMLSIGRSPSHRCGWRLRPSHVAGGYARGPVVGQPSIGEPENRRPSVALSVGSAGPRPEAGESRPTTVGNTSGFCDQGGIDQKRRGHHDWLQGAGPAGGGRGGAVWPVGRAQESPGSGRLAVDLAPAASAADPRTRDGARLRPAAISRILRANRTAWQNATVYPEGQPALLVLDDSGSNRDRGRDLQPDDDRQRDRAPTLSLSRKGREAFWPGLNLPPRSWDVSLIRRIRP